MQYSRRYKISMEILGWLGIGCILGAFAAVSFGLVSADGLAYPLVNGIGSAALVAASWYKRFYQLIVLNVVWFAISVVAITRVWLG